MPALSRSSSLQAAASRSDGGVGSGCGGVPVSSMVRASSNSPSESES